MTDRNLFDDPPAQRHSETSVAAAEDIASAAQTLRRMVLLYLKSRHPDGATDEEAQELLMMSPNTQRPRRVELVRAGLVRDSGRTRKTRSGRKAVVWEATS